MMKDALLFVRANKSGHFEVVDYVAMSFSNINLFFHLVVM